MTGYYTLNDESQLEFVQVITKPRSVLERLISNGAPPENIQRMARWVAADELEAVKVQTEHHQASDAAKADLLSQYPQHLTADNLPDVALMINELAAKLMAQMNVNHKPQEQQVQTANAPEANADIGAQILGSVGIN